MTETSTSVVWLTQEAHDLLTAERDRLTTTGRTEIAAKIEAARNWILEELRRSSEKLRVNFDTHIIPPQGRITKQVDLRNVIAILPGRSPRRIYVSGHYDSLNIGGQNRSNSAAITRPSRLASPYPSPPSRYCWARSSGRSRTTCSGSIRVKIAVPL